MTSQWIALTPQEVAHLGASESRGGQLFELLAIGMEWFRAANVREAGAKAFQFRCAELDLGDEAVAHLSAIATLLLNAGTGSAISLGGEERTVVIWTAVADTIAAQLLLVGDRSAVRMITWPAAPDEFIEELDPWLGPNLEIVALRGGIDVVPEAVSSYEDDGMPVSTVRGAVEFAYAI